MTTTSTSNWFFFPIIRSLLDLWFSSHVKLHFITTKDYRSNSFLETSHECCSLFFVRFKKRNGLMCLDCLKCIFIFYMRFIWKCNFPHWLTWKHLSPNHSLLLYIPVFVFINRIFLYNVSDLIPRLSNDWDQTLTIFDEQYVLCQ